jgi:hypothetical protein
MVQVEKRNGDIIAKEVETHFAIPIKPGEVSLNEVMKSISTANISMNDTVMQIAKNLAGMMEGKADSEARIRDTSAVMADLKNGIVTIQRNIEIHARRAGL